MSFTLHGLAVSGGIAIGRAHLISHAIHEVAQYQIREKSVAREIERFEQAFAAVRNELLALRGEAGQPGAPAELAAFVDVHALILEDPLLAETPKELIRSKRCNAEWALAQQMHLLVEQFEEIEDAYLRERASDVRQVVERVLKALMGRQRKFTRRSGSDEALIVVAHDLSPADTLQFKELKIGGFVTDLGGATSHTAIVARSLGIPAVVGFQHARSLIAEDDLLIVDGSRGVLIVDPDEGIVEEYRLRQSARELERGKLKRLTSARSVTLDGVRTLLFANIELPRDVEQVRAVNADGIGLFRTEFLFMNRDTLPTEDEQYEVYRSLARAMLTLGDKPVVLRTLDIGADKTAQALKSAARPSSNPALGQRAIRYCLAEPQIFLTQLRAMLRAASHGRVQILVPMLAHVKEIEQMLMMVWLAKEQLRTEHTRFNENVEIGGMIEVPAAALAISPFLKRLDFLSIGTNDLIQYTLAIDRTDEAVAHLYDPLHPAVLRLIAQTLAAGQRANVPVAVCGEIAGDTRLTRLLLGLGLREFSMHPAQILEVKQQILTANADELTVKAARILRCDEPEKIRAMVERL